MSKPRWDKVLLNKKTGKLEYRHYFAGKTPMNLNYALIAKGNYFELWNSLTKYLVENKMIKQDNLVGFMPKTALVRNIAELDSELKQGIDSLIKKKVE